MKILAIDLGGTSAKVGLVENEQIIKRWKIPTNKSNLFGAIKAGLPDLKDSDYDVIGLSIPGFVNNEGIITLSGNLNLKDYDPKKDAKKYFNKPIFVLNDANAATLGEYWVGAGKQFKNIIFYTIGTGIGGGIVINGELVTGKSGYAGELGHGGDFQHKYKCTCGLPNCIEATSSATGIEKLMKEHYGKKIELVEKSQAFINGDKEMTSILREALTPFAQHIVIMENALNPEAVIIGGGPSSMGEPLRKLIEDLVKENQFDFIANDTEILIAETKNDAGMLGAAYWALTKSK